MHLLYMYSEYLRKECDATVMNLCLYATYYLRDYILRQYVIMFECSCPYTQVFKSSIYSVTNMHTTLFSFVLLYL